MALRDFDTMVSMVEENITRDKNELASSICRKLGFTSRKAAEFFSNIDIKKRTLLEYIRDRKLTRALEEFIAGAVLDTVCEKYDLNSRNFYKKMKSWFPDKTPTDLRNANQQMEQPMYIKDIIENEGIAVMKTPTLNAADEKKYIAEIQHLITENTCLKNELSDYKMQEIHNETASDSNMVDEELYKKFLEIENVRVIYGFTVAEILSLYEESLQKHKSLEELCSGALDSFYFEVPDFEWDEPNYNNIYYHLEDEMDLGETWAYYFGDDDPYDTGDDPYAPTEEDMANYNAENYPDRYESAAYCEPEMSEEEIAAQEAMIDQAWEEATLAINKEGKVFRKTKIHIKDTKAENTGTTRDINKLFRELNDEDIPF